MRTFIVLLFTASLLLCCISCSRVADRSHVVLAPSLIAARRLWDDVVLLDTTNTTNTNTTNTNTTNTTNTTSAPPATAASTTAAPSDDVVHANITAAYAKSALGRVQKDLLYALGVSVAFIILAALECFLPMSGGTSSEKRTGGSSLSSMDLRDLEEPLQMTASASVDPLHASLMLRSASPDSKAAGAPAPAMAAVVVAATPAMNQQSTPSTKTTSEGEVEMEVML